MILIMCAVNITLRPLTCWGEILSFILAILLLATTICLPIALTVFILQNKTDEAQRHKIGLKLGSVYQDVRKDSSIRLLYISFYVFRRLIFSLSILFLDSCPMIQVSIFQLMSIFQLIYVGYCKPFEDPQQNRVELLNESTVSIISVMLPAFTDYLIDESGDIQNGLGWLILTLIAVSCSFNVFIQVKDQYRKYKITYRRWQCCRKWTRVRITSDTQKINLKNIKDKDINLKNLTAI